MQKTETQMKLIMRIREMRTKAGISQQQLAQILDITNGQIGNIESLRYPHKYTLNQLNLIAHHFHVPIESFFMAESEKELTIAEYTNRVCEYLEG